MSGRIAIPGTATNGATEGGAAARTPGADPPELAGASSKVSRSSVGSPDKHQIEELLKVAKKEDILRMQKLLNATVASMDDSLEPQDGDDGSHSESDGLQRPGSGAAGGNGHGNSGGVPVPTANPEAPLEKWVMEHVDTANPEDAHATGDMVANMLDAKLRAISRTGLDSLGKDSSSGGGASASGR